MITRIISLGEIVTPNVMKAIGAFTALIVNKNAFNNPNEIGKTIGGVLQARMALINDFKLGEIHENEFNSQMIAALEQATDVKLTVNEFNNAWSAMYPTFSQFSALLNEAIKFNCEPGKRIVFISFTNPKDIRYIVEQLEENGILYTMENDYLIEIAGIKLLTTYAEQKSKAELIELVVKLLKLSSPEQGSLAASIGSIFDVAQNKSDREHDIKYIRGVNDIKDPILKENFDITTQQVEEKAKYLLIETIIWKKFEISSFTEMLNNAQVLSKHISSSVL